MICFVKFDIIVDVEIMLFVGDYYVIVVIIVYFVCVSGFLCGNCVGYG